ncbi:MULTISPECIES: ABC transporter permease [unclassified Streptomyces]|uniref:ABC transporter permease n=1 Tax=unclassified Streptomyces TaxID=2593676 RepID=UPI0022504BEF|nr:MULTISPECIES: ABC transporter permease [unclassified Streptomyces]MCX4626101.1 ABC transporter permease [Streptomyces sp. NBC_01443]WSW48161.1 ABC transporter permease [Streptomyces sp. NBC_01001]
MTAYVRLEVRRTLRDTGFVVFGIGMPVLMYLLFTNLGTDAGAGEWKTASMVAMAAYGALGAALSTGNGVAEDKGIGWLRQLRVTPMTPRQVVAGRALTGSVIVLPAIAAVLAAGAFVNGVRLEAWQWAAVALVLWLGALPFTLLGIGNGYRLTAQSTGVVNVGCSLALSVVGGLWFPVELFPDWLRSLSGFTPTRRFAEIGQSLAAGAAPGLGAVAVLAAWALLFGSYAVFSYRRSARTV